jgi:hypothetical protein
MRSLVAEVRALVAKLAGPCCSRRSGSGMISRKVVGWELGETILFCSWVNGQSRGIQFFSPDFVNRLIRAVRIREVIRQSGCSSAEISILMYSRMTIFAENDAIIRFLKPGVLRIGRISRLIWDNVVRVINAVDQAHAAMGASIPLPEECLVLRVFVEIKCSCHAKLSIKFAINTGGSFSRASNLLFKEFGASNLSEGARMIFAPPLRRCWKGS